MGKSVKHETELVPLYSYIVLNSFNTVVEVGVCKAEEIPLKMKVLFACREQGLRMEIVFYTGVFNPVK